MLVSDYLAIGTLVILTLGAVVRVYSEKRGVSLPGRAIRSFSVMLRNPPIPTEPASNVSRRRGTRGV
jgi:hypothetical protein